MNEDQKSAMREAAHRAETSLPWMPMDADKVRSRRPISRSARAICQISRIMGTLAPNEQMAVMGFLSSEYSMLPEVRR